MLPRLRALEEAALGATGAGGTLPDRITAVEAALGQSARIAACEKALLGPVSTAPVLPRLQALEEAALGTTGGRAAQPHCGDRSRAQTHRGVGAVAARRGRSAPPAPAAPLADDTVQAAAGGAESAPIPEGKEPEVPGRRGRAHTARTAEIEPTSEVDLGALLESAPPPPRPARYVFPDAVAVAAHRREGGGERAQRNTADSTMSPSTVAPRALVGRRVTLPSAAAAPARVAPLRMMADENEQDGAMDKVKELTAEIKKWGLAGGISYGAFELLFWVVSVPIACLAFIAGNGHVPDMSNVEDAGKVSAWSLGFITLARFAVPFRIGIALALCAVGRRERVPALRHRRSRG